MRIMNEFSVIFVELRIESRHGQNQNHRYGIYCNSMSIMPRIRTINKNDGLRRRGRVVSETHKTVAKEMHPTGGRNQNNTSSTSDKVFAFTCIVCGETSKTRLVTKTRAIDEGREKRACVNCGATPFNKGKSHGVPLSDDLLKQLIHDPAFDITPPYLLISGMKELRYWQCDCKGQDKPFIFAATVSVRTRAKDPQNCPCCSYSGPRVDAENRHLYGEYLEMLIKDSRNRGYLTLLNEFPILHNAHFRCAEGHEFYASLKTIIAKNGCPTCYSNLRRGTNLSNVLHKDLWDEFVCAPAYPEFTMQDVPAGSSTTVVLWRCRNDATHEWLAYPFRRTGENRGCPYCGHKRLAKGESFAEKFPEIAAEFDSFSNLSARTGLPILPSSLRPNDRRQYFFFCMKGHELYKMSPKARTEGAGCPSCESIAVLRPDLAAQWHVQRNEGLSAENVTLGSHKKVWWICSADAQHVWVATVRNRVSGTGCPECLRKSSQKKKAAVAKDSEIAGAFDPSNEDSFADAKLRNTYLWNCKCGNAFKRRFEDLLRRGVLCRACSKDRKTKR